MSDDDPTVIDQAAREAFVLELRALTLKHGIAIEGCGCCGSPYLTRDVPVTDPRSGYAISARSEHLAWVDPSRDINWRHRQRELVTAAPTAAPGSAD